MARKVQANRRKYRVGPQNFRMVKKADRLITSEGKFIKEDQELYRLFAGMDMREGDQVEISVKVIPNGKEK